MDKMVLDWKKYSACARKAVAEGQVLVRNENHVLPLLSGAKLAVFGRIQLHYYKSGTGSGGMVNVSKVTGILDALLENKNIIVNQKLLKVYQEWEKNHPFDTGIGWGNEPWAQEEMPLSQEVVRAASEESEYGLVVIGRTAGEDQDNLNHPGSYLLTEIEEDMLQKVRANFTKMIVVLNVGNIMDMSFVDKYQPDAVLYAWQGGMIGGEGTVDVLTGAVCPSGKLSDTVAYEIGDYPSDKNFGNLDKNVYEEDIYVGYRYFETFAKERVRYPFGFGLSYTEFEITTRSFETVSDKVRIGVNVKNIGNCAGKEVLQVYVKAPQGQLGKPEKILAAFKKTRELMPGEEQLLMMEFSFETFASYDETGITGYRSGYVLEKGEYVFLTGNSIRNVEKSGSLVIDEVQLMKQCCKALAPEKKFRRMRPQPGADGKLRLNYEEAPSEEEKPSVRRQKNLPEELEITGDRGYQLIDVKNGRITMREFIGQLSVNDLSCMIRGEGMGSPKVTPGTASAFGGVSKQLSRYGIPCGCCTDGPSGMRLDSGMRAFSLPNGTLLACTFNTELIEELYTFTGIEMVKNKVDILLGPGMNIHRHPLNGRNFEYFSEDPLLTGKMAAAQVRALHRAGVTGALKHFCANNQETKRNEINCIISERALREIYLKGFEIAVKEAEADAVMTTYGAVNGLWTAGNYDLNTVILREEWGFKGIVMTDWWAKINDEGMPAERTNLAAMARAQNDLYMVDDDAEKNLMGDNTLASLERGTLTLGELQRNAMNICSFLMGTHAFERLNGTCVNVDVQGKTEDDSWEEQEITSYQMKNGELNVSLEGINTGKGDVVTFGIEFEQLGGYRVQMTAGSELGELAQMPVTLINGSIPTAVFSFNGTGGEKSTIERKIVFNNKYAVVRLLFGQSGLSAESIRFIFEKPISEIANEQEYRDS